CHRESSALLHGKHPVPQDGPRGNDSFAGQIRSDPSASARTETRGINRWGRETRSMLSSSLRRGRGGAFGNAPDGGFQVSRFEALGRLPETLEFIVPARLFGEDVDNEIDIVEQDPFRLTVAFRMRRIKTLALQTQFDFVRDRLDLAWIRPT